MADDPRPEATGLPRPADPADAERLERNAREAERHITEIHEAAEPDDRQIHEE